MLIDDLGYADFGCQGNTFHETPHLDKLAADGLRFTHAYSACVVCSPSRAALLTGQYPARLRITDWIPGYPQGNTKLKLPAWTQHLPVNTWNMAKAFHEGGYATASIGKWHLGGPAHYPEQVGFDVNIGGTERGEPGRYFPPYGVKTLSDGPADEFLSDRLTREACAWIEAQQGKPFFLYLPHYAVHTPLGGKPSVIEKYRRKARELKQSRNAVYAALVESVDDSVGQLRAKLAELKIDKQTIILVTSDNGGQLGGAKNPITSNAPLRSGKGSTYEGGIRVPMLMYWPNRTTAHSICDVPVMTIDIFPTLMETCGLRVPPDHVVDGESLAALTSSTARLQRGALYWHYPHYHPGGASPYSAIRIGEWRLVEYHEDQRVELFNLKTDESEKNNVAESEPERVKTLKAQLHAWLKQVDAQMPTVNPDYDPAKIRKAPAP